MTEPSKTTETHELPSLASFLALTERVASLEAGTGTTVPVPAPSTRIDLTRVDKDDEVMVGEVLTATTQGIAEGTAVWVHWFGPGWSIEGLVREIAVVEQGEIDFVVPDIPGNRILQLQVPNTQIKTDTVVEVLAEKVPAVPVDPLPSPGSGNYTAPDPPERTEDIIRLGPGDHNLEGRISRKKGAVTYVTGSSAAQITNMGYIVDGSVVIEGPMLRGTSKAPIVQGRKSSSPQCWIIGSHAEGLEFSKKDGWKPTWSAAINFGLCVYIGGKHEQFRRGANANAWHGLYGTEFSDLYEDLWQSGGIIRDVTATRIGWPHYAIGAHPDILQCPGRVDVDGLTVTDWIGQGFALGGSNASGSRFRNISMTDRRDTDRLVGHGAMIENADGRGGSSDILFENVVVEGKSIVVRTSGPRKWLGKNIEGINASFQNKTGDWRY